MIRFSKMCFPRLRETHFYKIMWKNRKKSSKNHQTSIKIIKNGFASLKSQVGCIHVWALGGPSGLINKWASFFRRISKILWVDRWEGRIGYKLDRKGADTGGEDLGGVKRTLRRKKKKKEKNSTVWKPFPSLTRTWAASGPGADLSIYLSIHLYIYPSIHRSIYPSIHLSIYISFSAVSRPIFATKYSCV